MRYFIAALVGMGLIILVIVLIFHGGGSNGVVKPVSLADYVNATSGVRLTIDGPVTASQTHYQAQITVTENDANLSIIQGYEGTVIDSSSYPMNPSSYAVFLRALDKQGFTKGNPAKALADERGYCATGSRYIFELRDGEKQIDRFWSTSCGSGTYKGNAPTTRSLFEAQIPDFGTKANKVGL